MVFSEGSGETEMDGLNRQEVRNQEEAEEESCGVQVKQHRDKKKTGKTPSVVVSLSVHFVCKYHA